MPPRDNRTDDEKLADDMATLVDDPLGYVLYVFPWETEKSIQMVRLPEKYRARYPNSEWGPDEWACEFLDALGEDIRDRGFDGQNAVMPIMYSTRSGHGIGKSVLVAWLIKFIMDTRPFAKGVVTASTDAQLRTKTWAELGKWHKMSITAHLFDYASGRGSMSLTRRGHKETWRCDAQTCREENSESFAGLHAANSTPFYIFDEASGIPSKIFEVREGGTTDGEPMVFDFGNPTRNSGSFFENCVGKFAARYRQFVIDSRSVAITNKKRIQQWIEDYGLDSDFVRVRVLGLFPKSGSLQFIGTDIVNEAMERPTPGNNAQAYARLVIGVDVARFGDDSTVILPRIGDDVRSFEPVQLNGADLLVTVDRVIAMVNQFRALGKEYSMIFVDETGVGGGVVDILRRAQYRVMGVSFGRKALDEKKYRFRVDEIWGKMKEAIEKSLVLPALQGNSVGTVLRDQLTQREYGYTIVGNKIQLESKDDMKKRGIQSPDIADALALTFAMDIDKLPDGVSPDNGDQGVQAGFDYNPFKGI